MKCPKPSPTGTFHSQVDSTMERNLDYNTGGYLTQNPPQATSPKNPETSPRTFRGERVKGVGGKTQVQDSTNQEVGGYLPQEEGEDPHTKRMNGLKNIKNGMKTKHLVQAHQVQDPTETSKIGKKIHGKTTRTIWNIKIAIDPRVNTSGTLI